MTVCDLGNIGKMIVLQFKFQNLEMCFLAKLYKVGTRKLSPLQYFAG